MANAANYIPAFQFGHKVYPQNMISPSTPVETGNVWFVDGDTGTGGAGGTWEDAFATIGAAISAASAGDVIYIGTRTITALATDPISYEETLIIPNAKSNLSLIGINRGRTQGGLPQLKDSTSTSPILSIRAPGCLVTGLGFNGAGNTAGAIELKDDGGTTNVAFGTTITGCHIKNAKGSTSTSAKTGGGIFWTSDGGAWQINISGNTFYKCTADVSLIGTSSSRPQDVVIEGNTFSGPAGSVDCNLYLAGGSGIDGVTIRDNVFPLVDLPSLGSGTVLRYIDATGCTGVLANNMFSFVSQAPAKTFAAAGTGALIPTTMRMAGNYGEADTTGDTGYIHRA